MRRRTFLGLLGAAGAARAAELRLSKELYAFDNGTGRDQGLPLEEQAATLERAGFAGMGLFSGTRRVPEMLAALDRRGLKLLGIYVQGFVDGTEPHLEDGLAEAIGALAGRDVMVVLTLRGQAPGAAQRAVAVVREAARMAAAAGLRVCLYPHIDFHVETAADAMRVIEAAGEPNVGVTLNLYHTLAFHWKRCGTDEFDFAALIRRILPRLWLVSINGMERTASSVNVARLDRGDYDLGPFLRALNEAGYRGPVSLQCYRVAGDIEENLRAARAKWLELVGALGRE